VDRSGGSILLKEKCKVYYYIPILVFCFAC